jgi:hypothetical protein
MADHRAMEEQMERHNPVNPKKLLSNRRENTMRLSGAGATPSMGLSEYRGGKKHNLMDHLANPMEGMGRADSDSDEEACGMGRALSTHLTNLHGKGFHRSFMRGMGASEQQRAHTMLGENKKGRSRNNGPRLLSGNVNGVVSGGMRPGIGYLGGAPSGSGMLDQPMPISGTNMSLSGSGHMVGGAYKHGQSIGELTEYLRKPRGGVSMGAGDTGAYEGQGKKPRKPNARAAVVKRVMSEKGMSMIEASKYVKAHNLY